VSNADGYIELGEAFPVDDQFIDRYFRRYVLGGGARRTALEILEARSRLGWCLNQSFRHVNQFDKVVLGASPADGRKLVWHRWRLASDGSAPELHNHRWSFVSYLLSGSIHAEDYQVHQIGTPAYRHYRYQSPGAAQHYVMTYQGRASLQLSAEHTYLGGEFYYQPYQTVHSARAGEAGASTLIMQGEVRSTTTDVFVEQGTSPASDLERQVHRFTRPELGNLLEELVQQLPSNSAP
jgi:hypothetical protein